MTAAQKGEAVFAPTNTASANYPTPSKARIHAVNDIATPISRSALNTKRDRKTAAAEAAFIRGRDLAITMIDAGDDVAFKAPDSATTYRAYRHGKAQIRFTEPFLLQLLADPSMLDGFNAVLSAKLADECFVEAASYRVSMAEYSEGVVGADGTMSDPQRQEPERDFGKRAVAIEQAGEDASQALLNGYSARQITTVQEEIATRAASIGECLRDLRDDPDTPQSTALYWSLNGAADMADMIGLLADAVTGGAIKGDATAWLIGPNFASEGKAVSA
ncbi:hypothetical protein A3K87_09835 [Variovorax paradoxus]|uniref:Uncharacterized protein n=1 Tax=Variovorax paradoxus TaxID=34073 RepID=A0AA91ICF3_VARPD|nr:hypothetical protein [Variovorax paradoxus]OAK66056.1 hypothetical protein A3K87_09835 [Variovorax paradoxus]